MRYLYMLLAIIAVVLATYYVAKYVKFKNDTPIMTNIITIDKRGFNPETAVIDANESVVFENDDKTNHTVIGMKNSFHTAAIKPGKKYSQIFQKSGTYDFYLKENSALKGRVVAK